MPNTNPKIIPIVTPKTSGLIAEIERLRAYIKAIDPPIQPITETSRNLIFRDGFIPSWAVIKMFQLSKSGHKPRWVRLRERALRFVNLGMFGGEKCQ